MSMPTVTLWTFDGPADYESDSNLPPPPPPEKNADKPLTSEEELYDLPAADDDRLWSWDNNVKNVSQQPYAAPPSTPPKITTTSRAASGSHKSIAERVLSGEHHNATFEGTSQYAHGGSSACGLASMNAIRLAFEYCAKLSDPVALISALVSETYVKEAMAIATSWPDEMHLEVEPILQLPLFSSSLQLLDTRYGEARFRTFSDAVIALKTGQGPRAAFLTRPPEMIGIMHIPPPATALRLQTKSIFLIFDSHPRPNHPNGAAVQIFPSVPSDDIADYLTDLFQVDEALMDNPHLEWHAQLLGQVSYHLLAPVGARDTPNEYALDMQFLTLYQRVDEAERKLKDGEHEKRRLKSKVFDLEQEVALFSFTERKQREEIEQLKSQVEQAPGRRPNNGWFSGQRHTNTGDKGKRREDTQGRFLNARPSRSGTSNFEFSSAQASARPRALPNTPPRPSGGSSSSDFEFSAWGQPPVRYRPPQAMPPKPSQLRTVPSSSNSTPGPSNSRKDEPRAEDVDAMRSLELAMAMQREFDEEREAIMLDESLTRAAERPKFDCGICMESLTDEAIALVEGCNHSCCRDCMRANIESKIGERRYPIPCPFCVAGSDIPISPGSGAGFIPASLVETIGVSPELFNVYTEMQLAEYSVMIDCRGCSQSAFVDRKDYELAKVITCPMPECCHTWCKQCSQSIEGGAKHSCDGSVELETLMNQRGWKHCPGCRTPIERFVGCNHMTCTTPGCNMHFCYKCGALVCPGGTRNEISAAVANHYRTCELFEVPPDI